MKKLIAGFLVASLWGGCGSSYAYIDSRINSFDGIRKVYSVQQNIKGLTQLTLVKVIDKEDIYFEISIATDLMKKHDFSQEYAEVKIDGKIYKMGIIKNVKYKDTDNGLYSIESSAKLPNESLASLKTAKNVVLRFHRENDHQDIVDVPDNVLAEWKQVIATDA